MTTYIVFSAIFAFFFVKDIIVAKKNRRKNQILPSNSQILQMDKFKKNAKSEFSIHH